MNVGDREALIELVEYINGGVCEAMENPEFLTSLNFCSTGSLAYLGMSCEEVWNEDGQGVEEVFDFLTCAYDMRLQEAAAALRCLKDLKREGHYKQFYTPVDEEE